MIRRSGALVLLVLLFAAAPAVAAPITVNVRVEGVHTTFFEGNVTTAVHSVDGGDGTGAHKCDGTNNGASATPGPTVTGGFDDGARLARVTWGGSWSASFQDFLINRVGSDSSTSSKFWSLVLNDQDLSVGGCQQKVKPHDRVLVAFDGFGRKLLELSGPKTARVGRSFQLTVVDGRSGQPVKGAKVRHRKTDKHGRVRLTLKRPGLAQLKARKFGTIRSNELDVQLHAH